MATLKFTHFLDTFFLTALLLLSSFLYAQTSKIKNDQSEKSNADKSGILFTESSWDAALKKALLAHKYIFVDAYASWCGPCKLLKATTFKDKEVAAFFNKHFINLSIDMEKGEGETLSSQWQIQAYPTLVIFDATGKVIQGTVGFLKPNDLIKLGKHALEKSN